MPGQPYQGQYQSFGQRPVYPNNQFHPGQMANQAQFIPRPQGHMGQPGAPPPHSQQQPPPTQGTAPSAQGASTLNPEVSAWDPGRQFQHFNQPQPSVPQQSQTVGRIAPYPEINPHFRAKNEFQLQFQSQIPRRDKQSTFTPTTNPPPEQFPRVKKTTKLQKHQNR